MILEEFASFVSQICAHTPLSAERPLLWTIIANPKAGGFTIKSRWKKHKRTLEECVQTAQKNPRYSQAGPSQTALREGKNEWGLIPTKALGHAKELCSALINEAACAGKSKPFFLIITAGGDGTSLEVMTALYHASAETRRNFAVLRLPMGTGNDGADDWDLGKALTLIIDKPEIKMQRAVRLSTASGKGPFLAFNILSVGLDAFVTHMANKMKSKLPGDSYKLWVDIAALFYDRLYKVDFMDIRSRAGEGEEEELITFREKLLLIAVGESGYRSYGSRKLVLPDSRNVCAIKQTSLFRKLVLKGYLSDGRHVNKAEALFWNSHSVEFTARHPILAQMDGETVLLDEMDYPAIIELTEPVIPVFRKINMINQRG